MHHEWIIVTWIGRNLVFVRLLSIIGNEIGNLPCLIQLWKWCLLVRSAVWYKSEGFVLDGRSWSINAGSPVDWLSSRIQSFISSAWTKLKCTCASPIQLNWSILIARGFFASHFGLVDRPFLLTLVLVTTFARSVPWLPSTQLKKGQFLLPFAVVLLIFLPDLSFYFACLWLSNRWFLMTLLASLIVLELWSFRMLDWELKPLWNVS